MSCRFFFFFLTLRARRADAQPARSRPAAQNHTQNIKFFTTLQLHLSPIYPPFIPLASGASAALRKRSSVQVACISPGGTPPHRAWICGPALFQFLFRRFGGPPGILFASVAFGCEFALRLVAFGCVWLRYVAFGCIRFLRYVAFLSFRLLRYVAFLSFTFLRV